MDPTPPMIRILFCHRIGRTYDKRGGGYFNAGMLFAKYASSVPGVELTSANIKQPPESTKKKPDLLWVFGGSERAEGFIQAAREWGVPLLLDAGYNTRKGRSKWIRELLGNEGVYVGVFSNAALHDPAFRDVRERVVVLPHPFALGNADIPFEARRGICVGDVGKLTMKNRTGFVDGLSVVRALLDKGFPLTGLRQYSPSTELPKKLQVNPYQRKGFPESLADYRLFVSLAQHETFAMVPMEAAAVGTPVIYPHMPQSLNEYLGPAGLRYRDEKDLVELVEFLYRDEYAWNGMSHGGRQTARAHAQLIGPQLLETFKRVLRT